MATSPTRSSTGSTGTARRQVQRGPLKRTFHFFVQVTDEQGNVIPGAKLKVDRIISDARKVIEFMDQPGFVDLGLTRIKHEVVSTKKGETDGATQVG